MINYQDDSEPDFAKFFAQRLKDTKALSILTKGSVNDREEAVYLSQFFWRMVDQSIKDDSDLDSPWKGSSEYWTEKLYNSFGGYLESAGYSQVWDAEIDKQ
jgi:hypothetical protein